VILLQQQLLLLQQQQQPKRKVQKQHTTTGVIDRGGTEVLAKRDGSKPPPLPANQKSKRSIDFKADNTNNPPLASIIPPLPHALVESIRR